MDICEKYGTAHDIKFNPKKSAMLICNSSYTRQVCFAPFMINDECINIVESVRYLGHIISDDNRDDQDIQRQCM